MKRKSRIRSLIRRFSALLALTVLLSAVPCRAGEDVTRILVVETTDVHGYIMDASSGDPATFEYRLAYIAHLINEARKSDQYDDVLLLDGGDLYQGTPFSNLTGGAVIRAAFDRMKYDAVALGNHDFDWDVTEYAADGKGTMAPYILGDCFGDPETPVLASGLYDAASGKRVSFTRDYAVIEKAGKRIAVVGYIPDYRTDIMTERIAPYRIDGKLGSLRALVRRIRDTEKPDAVVILAHEEPKPVAEAMDPEQVSLVAGGHTHEIAADTARNGIPCIQGRCYAQGFASAVLVFGPDGVTVENVQYVDITKDRALLRDTGENAAHLDPGIMTLSHAVWEAVSDEMGEVLGYIDKPVTKGREPGASSGGNWLTGLMLRATRPEGTVAAFFNTGGIRTSFEIPKGAKRRNITVYDVYSIAPFGNSLLVYEISGAELKQHLINGLKNPGYGDQMTGLTFTYSATGDPDTDRADREYTILSITLSDGTEVNPEDEQTLYRVCVSNFSATIPGSVFEGKEPVVPDADAPIDNETYIRILREERQANSGYIEVDDGPRGIETEAPEDAGDGEEIPDAA